MTRRLIYAVSFVATLASCDDPTPFDNSVQFVDAGGPPASEAGPQPPQPNNDCPANADWLPVTPPVQMYEPLPHPNPECPFYRGGFQNFLIAMQPDQTGDPAILSYPTIDDAFISATPHATRNTKDRAWLGDIKQAGQRQILIDQNGHTLYYGIHMNQAFADFIMANGLETLAGVQNADPRLFLPAGLVEFKSAWQDIDPADGVTADYSNYITTTAWVPTLHQDPTTHLITEDKNHPRQIKLALIAIHTVYTFPGHPELIWTSFQHVDPGGNDNLQGVEIGVHANDAPVTGFLPTLNDPNNLQNSTVVSQQTDYLLYHAGTPANQSNQAIPETQLVLNDTTQSFTGQGTSIYRQFPGSKSNQIDPDDDVTSLNSNMAAVFAQSASTLSPQDKRQNYRLVGAQWLDKPAFFALNATFQNDPATSPLLQPNAEQDGGAGAGISQDDERQALLAMGVKPTDDLLQNGSDSPFSLSGGEDRISSTAMESFTQSPVAFPNCFSCHATTAINSNGVPVGNDTTTPKLLDPKLINVSHLFSQFVLEETGP
jgi:hypothetical protein